MGEGQNAVHFSLLIFHAMCRYGIAVAPLGQPEWHRYFNPFINFPHLPWWLKTRALRVGTALLEVCLASAFSGKRFGLRKGEWRSERQQ